MRAKRRVTVAVLTLIFVFIELWLRNVISQHSVYGLWNSLLGNVVGILRINNYGVALGLLGNSSLWIMLLVGLSFLFVIYLFWFKHKKESTLKCCAMVFFFSGAICNMIDRVVLGYVRDYLAIRIGGYSLPILNLSDIMIGIGIVIFLIIIIRSKEEDYV